MICKEVLIIMKKNQKDILLQDWLDTWYEIVNNTWHIKRKDVEDKQR